MLWRRNSDGWHGNCGVLHNQSKLRLGHTWATWAGMVPCSYVIANPKFPSYLECVELFCKAGVASFHSLFTLPLRWFLHWSADQLVIGCIWSRVFGAARFFRIISLQEFSHFVSTFSPEVYLNLPVPKIQGHYTSLGFKRMSSIIGTERQLSTNLVFAWSHSLTIIILLLPYYRN